MHESYGFILTLTFPPFLVTDQRTQENPPIYTAEVALDRVK